MEFKLENSAGVLILPMRLKTPNDMGYAGLKKKKKLKRRIGWPRKEAVPRSHGRRYIL